MSRPRKSRHTGVTASGSTRDAVVGRVGRVTIYQRGTAYYVYYREKQRSIRRKVDGNLATASAVAGKISASLEEGSPSPFGYARIPVGELVPRFLEYCQDVQGLTPRSVDRYRAALSHLKRFAESQLRGSSADQITAATVEDFVGWLRRQSRTRNGAESGERTGYSAAGIKFILNTCGTAFQWAAKRRYLPAYAENPFRSFPIDRAFRTETSRVPLFSPEEQRRFLAACDEWQQRIFLVLAVYGVRVGELSHLLISDLQFEERRLLIRSKPELFWSVKTGRERVLPIIPEFLGLFERLVAGRAEGFVFLNRRFTDGREKPIEKFASARAFFDRLRALARDGEANGAQTAKETRRRVVDFLRAMGQIPEKRVRQEFIKVAKRIGRPDATRVHSLRHLFSTRAQEIGLNPLLVKDLLGHATLDMTARYTHFGPEAHQEALRKLLAANPALQSLL